MLDRDEIAAVRHDLALWARHVPSDFLPRLVRMLEVDDRRLTRGSWTDCDNPLQGCLAEIIGREHPLTRESDRPGSEFLDLVVRREGLPSSGHLTEPDDIIVFWDGGELDNKLAASVFRAELKRRKLTAITAPPRCALRREVPDETPVFEEA